MKNRHLEKLRMKCRLALKRDRWIFDEGGIHARHLYQPGVALSWWSDFEFVLHGRLITLWWVHPRMKYAAEISERGWQESGPPPPEVGWLENTTPIMRAVGKSRKKCVAHRLSARSDAWHQYVDHHIAIEDQLRAEGIDFEARPSLRVQTLNWCVGVDICVPIKIRSPEEARVLVSLAWRLLKREATLEREFPGYGYGREERLAEAGQRSGDVIAREANSAGM
mgnify:CR=1 FL=1